MTHLSITFPDSLKTALDNEAKREHTKRSTMIQTAVRFYLEMKRKKVLRDSMKEGYMASAAADRKLAGEWDAAVADGLD